MKDKWMTKSLNLEARVLCLAITDLEAVVEKLRSTKFFHFLLNFGLGLRLKFFLEHNVFATIFNLEHVFVSISPYCTYL